MDLAGYQIDDRIPLPPKADYGIGIVGCGGIVNDAHLPAYTAADLKVVACFDQNQAAAEQTAAAHGIPRVARSLEELFAAETVEIVDVAVTPWDQPVIARAAITAGKHLLCQKPLADTMRAAVEVVEAARAAGVKVAVNQQMRWDAGIRVAHQLIEQGAIGRPADARIQVSVRTPWHLWPWIARQERIDVVYHSIHYLDSMRYLFGDPVRVTARHGRYPDQPEVGETKTVTVLEYDDGLQAVIDVNHHDWSDDAAATFRVLGTSGTIRGTIGLLYDYPHGRVDTLEYQPHAEPRAWHAASLTTRWIPDAFLGPMASLMTAIQTGAEPLTSAADNLGTLRCVAAAYRSAADGRTVALAEVDADAPLIIGRGVKE
ncbi:MAG: Gfo/Idh/MocA family protein [Thermomicrobiales bacterium]